MNKQQIWEHLNRKYKDSEERATFLYEVFYNRDKLVSYETRGAIHETLNTPICTGVLFGQLARQITERNRIYREENNRDTEKADLENITGFLENFVEPFGISHIEGERFCASYVQDKMLMVSMMKEGPLMDRLAKSFSKVIKYRPFCKYTDLGGMKTYEWAKNDEDERFQAIIKEGKSDLVRFEHDAMKQPERETMRERNETCRRSKKRNIGKD